MDKITDRKTIAAVFAYCNGMGLPCWAVQTPAGSTIGGFACRISFLSEDAVEIEIANGDHLTVPWEEIHLRAA